ncbi:MAG TPA: pitrilysin family protein [bacterium]|jgi:zinc protease
MKTIILLYGSLCFSGLLAAAPPGAQNATGSDDPVPAYVPPPVSTLAPVKLPPIQEKILKNGLKVIIVEFHEVPVVALRLQCRAGSFFDPPGKAGLIQFMTGLLTQGTESLSATQIAEKIDFVGGNISASSGWDASNVECSVLKKHLNVAVDLLRDVALHPAFAEDEIERLRQQTLSSIKNAKDQPDNLADEEFDKWLFGGFPYAQPIGGTEASVASFTRDDVLAQYHKIFLPNQATLAVIGDVTAKDGFRIAENMFGDWKTGSLPEVATQPPQPPQGYRIHIVDKADATQAQIRLGHLGVARHTEDYFPLVVMNYILGGGGFASRMMKTIRAELGLTYGIGSSFSMRRQAGPFIIDTFTKNESTLQAIQETIKLVKKFQEEGPTEKELADAKSYLEGSYPLNFETPGQIAGQLLNIDLYRLGADYIEKYRSRVVAVTAADVKRVARRYIHPDDLNIVVVSKVDEVKSALESLGPVEVITVE